MKYILAFTAALAVVALVCDSSVIKADSRANLSVGWIAAGDRLFYRNNFIRAAGGPNVIQSQDVIWRGNANNKVSAVRAYEVGGTQNASAWIVGGGIGYSNVTVRLQSARGRGFYYQLEIYGR